VSIKPVHDLFLDFKTALLECRMAHFDLSQKLSPRPTLPRMYPLHLYLGHVCIDYVLCKFGVMNTFPSQLGPSDAPLKEQNMIILGCFGPQPFLPVSVLCFWSFAIDGEAGFGLKQTLL
jgi:hypothetical protein